jgi:hypothetical protein
MSGNSLNLVFGSFASWKPSPKQSYEVSTAHLPLPPREARGEPGEGQKVTALTAELCGVREKRKALEKLSYTS